jgi:hypothetical protein
MSLARHDLETCVRDFRGYGLTEAGRHEDVEPAGEHQRRRGDLREPVGRVMCEADVDLRLKVLERLLMGEGRSLSMISSTEPSSCAQGV